MTEDRGQRADNNRQGRKPFLGLCLAPCALSLVPFFKNKPAISYQTPVTSDQQPVASNAFTLLEVMVAMAIMAIVLVSVYRMHSQTLAMNTANRFYTQAPMLAQSKLAQLESGASEIIAGDSGDFGDKFPGYSWNVSVEEVAIESLGEIANDFKQIDLTVSFNGDEYVYNVRTYRLMRD
jgi:general secretion pathway protein I